MSKIRQKKNYLLLWAVFQRIRTMAVRAIPSRQCNFFNVIGILAMCYFFVTMASVVRERNNQHSANEVIVQNPIYESTHHEETTSTKTPESLPKVILFWTPYYNRSDFTIGFGKDPFVKAGCKVTNCIATADRSQLSKSDAVVFHALQFAQRDIPKTRLPNQRFVFFLYETIPNTSVPCIGKCLPSSQYTPHYFNWTMTHRRDSDVYVAEPYGAIQPKYWTLPSQLPDEIPRDTLPPNPVDLLNVRYPELANKTNMVAWFSSHCPTHSQREDYVKELAKHVQVDIYGKCGTMECLPRNSQHCESLLTTYKFYLAAENSLCPDYVTEKFYRALTNNLIPIVYGGADYTQYAPPHSFINIADFKSPKDLADYLNLLNKNDALYMEYFQWKKHYAVVRSPMKGWCDLCSKLNEPDQHLEIKTYEDVNEWWVRKLPCYPGSSFLANHL